MPHRSAGRDAVRSRLRRTLAVGVALILGVTAQPMVASAAPADPGAAVSRELLAELAAKGSTSFMVYLDERANLSGVEQVTDSDARATEVYRQLTSTAERSQRALRTELDKRGSKYKSFWIANALRVEGDTALVESIAARSEIASIEPSRTYKLVEPERRTDGTRSGVQAVEWNVTNIEAPRVWSEFETRGEGVVVANIDSGVQFDHPALDGSYRGNNGGSFDHNYNWFDPAGICPNPAPCDNNGHGTHTMGTMVGDDGAGNQVGVAPGARWIAAKGCETNGCSDNSLLESGQFVLAPTDLNGQNPRPDLHADIVNNSWGDDVGNDEWYRQTVAAWRLAGMFPTFSIGNEGPGCNTAGSPGDNPGAYAVGSYDVNNSISSFSSRGASRVDGAIKPNVAAPGSNIRSSVPGNTYGTISGTSMAAPHVSATVALIWSAAPVLRGEIAATEALLDDTATDVNALTCGGTLDDNNTFGEGRLNAFQAVSAAPRGAGGRISGTVTKAADGTPIQGATVQAGSANAVTGPDGNYALIVSAGDVTLTASAFGYGTQTATVTVLEGETVDRDFALTTSPTVRVSGKITDGSGHGWPLYARIDVPGLPGGPVFSNPVTGAYSFSLPGNTSYRFTTTAKYPGYRTVTTDVAVTTTAKTVDISVPVDPACTAVGYAPSMSAPLASESFDAATAPAGWSVVNRTDKGGWAFNDPGGRGNLTGGTGNFAIVDSDALGTGNTQDTDLVTPVMDLSTAGAPVLRFNNDWRAVGVNDTADIDVTTDGGANWANVWHQTLSRRGPRVEEIPLQPLAGSATAQIRFRFKGTFAWWWEIDNFQLLNQLCNPTPGGLVAGFTTDSNTGSALNGVTVVSGDEPLDKAVSAGTPDDPNIPDGFYWMFSSLTGAHPFTASRSPYQPLTRSVDVPADNTRRADFALRAGRLTVSPTELEMHQPYGTTRTAQVTITNTGNSRANVELLEQAGRFDLLSRQGATLVEHKMKGISKSFTGTAYGAEGNVAAGAPLIDPAWTRVANTPSALFDNAAATLDGKVYTIGGGTGSGNERKAWVYDPGGNAWTALPDLPIARSKPSVAALGGKIYVIGGWGVGGTMVSTVDVLDPLSQTWSTLPGVTNPTPRASAGTAVTGGLVYMVGGCADAECTDSANVVVFDPSDNTFSAGASYPQAASWMACGGIGGKVYCAGGAGASEFKSGFVYDPGANQWSPIPDLPVDLWGSQYSAASGLLVLAGGVTSASTAVTNRTLAYDPAAGAWVNLPNIQFARFRGAGACGAYKVGGSPTSFVGSAETERLGGLDQCVEAGEMPWLSTTPSEFALAPGASRVVTVTFTATAAAGVAQPGTYTGQFGIVSDTPYTVPSVGVEMNVSPPGNWGKVQGTVIGQTCGGVQVPVRATVRVNLVGDSSVGYTLTADGQGHYAYWVPRGRYDLIAAKDGWVPQVKRQVIQPGLVSTLDYTLGPVSPCPARLGGI